MKNPRDYLGEVQANVMRVLRSMYPDVPIPEPTKMIRTHWERDPFVLVEENGYFYGRGTYDVKDGVATLASTFLRL